MPPKLILISLSLLVSTKALATDEWRVFGPGVGMAAERLGMR